MTRANTAARMVRRFGLMVRLGAAGWWSSGILTAGQESAQVWPTDLLLRVLPKLLARKVLVPCGYSMLRVTRYRDDYARLPALLEGYDRLVHLQADHGGEGEIVPAGWLRMEVRAEGARIGRSASFSLQKPPISWCG